MILATIFVSLPFVVREVVPVLREIGTEQEQAASTLGASWRQTFLRVTLPAIRWGLGYGIVLATARALGEFGAVSVVSGKIQGQTETMTLFVEQRFHQFDLTGRLRGIGRARPAGDLSTLLVDEHLRARARTRSVDWRNGDRWESQVKNVTQAVRRLRRRSTTSRSRCRTAR